MAKFKSKRLETHAHKNKRHGGLGFQEPRVRKQRAIGLITPRHHR